MFYLNRGGISTHSPAIINCTNVNQESPPLAEIFNHLNVVGVSFSASDAEFLTSVAAHLADATIHGDRSKIQSCAGLLAAFCAKFSVEGVAHE